MFFFFAFEDIFLVLKKPVPGSMRQEYSGRCEVSRPNFHVGGWVYALHIEVYHLFGVGLNKFLSRGDI